MLERPKTIYWDANCFLAYVNEETDRVAVLESLLESSARGEVDLHTSAISQVEAAFGFWERETRALDPNVESVLDSLWSDPEVVDIVGYDDEIGLAARNMIRDVLARGWSLKAMDAIQLASAQSLLSGGVAVDEFHTYDRSLFKYADIAGFPIIEPRVP